MQAIKKVEIIIGYMKLPQLLDVLKKEVLAVSYTVIKEAFGAGGRGEMAGDGLSGEFTNSYLLIACSEDEANRIVEVVRPILKRLGGLCLVSDAMLMKHQRFAEAPAPGGKEMRYAACIDIAKPLSRIEQTVQESPGDDGKLFASRVYGIAVALQRPSTSGMLNSPAAFSSTRACDDSADIPRPAMSACLIALADAVWRGDRLCELSVIELAANVCQTTIVLDAWEHGQLLAVYGWVQGLQDGLIRDVNFTVSGWGKAAAAQESAISSLF